MTPGVEEVYWYIHHPFSTPSAHFTFCFRFIRWLEARQVGSRYEAQQKVRGMREDQLEGELARFIMETSE